MMPALTRNQMNRSDDIIREVGLAPIRRRRGASFGLAKVQCEGKVAHANKAGARLAADKFEDLNAYRCPHCRLWHVGNRNKG